GRGGAGVRGSGGDALCVTEAGYLDRRCLLQQADAAIADLPEPVVAPAEHAVLDAERADMTVAGAERLHRAGQALHRGGQWVDLRLQPAADLADTVGAPAGNATVGIQRAAEVEPADHLLLDAAQAADGLRQVEAQRAAAVADLALLV